MSIKIQLILIFFHIIILPCCAIFYGDYLLAKERSEKENENK